MLFLYVFITVIFINCAYHLLFLWLGLSGTKKQHTTNTHPPISVLVYIKNNVETLETNLKAILNQKYPDFEIILINDSSIDDSLEIIEKFQQENTDFPIQITNVRGNEMFWGSKKYALTLGIKRAKNEFLLFTDGHCKPLSNQWIKEMSQGFLNNKDLVLGYSNYAKRKGLFNLFLRFDTLLNAIHYLSFAKAKMAYMGVGRNLAYTSKVYYNNNGFISHVKMPVGDDDLFVNEIATKNNTSLVYNKNAHVEATPLKNWDAWHHSRKQRAWTFRFYKTKHKLILSLYFFSTFFFWLGAISAFFLLSWQTATFLIAIRLLVQYISIGIPAKKLGAGQLIPYIPCLEFVLIFLQMKTLSYYIKKPPNRNW